MFGRNRKTDLETVAPSALPPHPRVGMMVRGEDRGLGNLTWEAHRHLQPSATMLVDIGRDANQGFTVFEDRYPNAFRARWHLGPGHFEDPASVREWLDQIDVLYTAETFYDWRIVEWAREQGVATVVHVMPEFFKADLHNKYRPTAVWTPTPWRIDTLPEHTKVVPIPVALDRFPPPPATDSEWDELRVLHVAGRRAAADRNGTNLLFQSLRQVTQPMTVTVATQDRRLPSGRTSSRVTLRRQLGGITSYADLYADGQVLVMPRRYGGLCLPVQEAMAAGLAVVMGDCEPNGWWPTIPVGGRFHGEIEAPAGSIPLFETDVAELGQLLDRLSHDREMLWKARCASHAWAVTHDWGSLAPMWRTGFLDAYTAFCGER